MAFYGGIWTSRNLKTKTDWNAVFTLILHHLALLLHTVDNNFSYTGMDLYRSPIEISGAGQINNC